MQKHLFGIIIVAAMSLFPSLVPAEVHVNVSLPPPITFSAPPDVVVIPSNGADVYMVPETVGLYFYGGHWYRFHDGYWFRSPHYNTPWAVIDPYLVPAPVAAIPYDYILHMPPTYHRIPYHAFHSHWRTWGPNRYWHDYQWYKDHSRHRWAGQPFHKPPVRHYNNRNRPPQERGPRPFVGHPNPRYPDRPHVAGTIMPAPHPQPHDIKEHPDKGRHAKRIEAKHHDKKLRGENGRGSKGPGGKHDQRERHGRDR